MLPSFLTRVKEKPLFLFSKNKSAFLSLFLFLIFLGLFLPTHSAQAVAFLPLVIIALVGIAGGAALLGQPFLLASLGELALTLLILIIQLPLFLASAFFWLAIVILNWVTSPEFIILSYTNPANNYFIDVGWTLTRDLTNMAFVIILVAIGLATALRISEYQWQKTLPPLIFIALFINFTPAILGIIVDAANIIMNFFLEDGANFDIFYHVFNAHLSTFWSNLQGDHVARMTTFAISLMLLFFGFIGGLILLLYAALFIMRYVAIWTLVILSPIAFICFILPKTRSIWNMWWNQFIQWSFIGAIAGFFLYLSMHLLLLARPGGEMITRLEATRETEEVVGLLNDFLPFMVVIVFLIIGLFSAFATSAMGASQVINFAQKQAKKAPAWAGKGAAKSAAWAGEKAKDVPLGRLGDAGERLRKKLEGAPLVSHLPGLRPGDFETAKQARIKTATEKIEKIPDTKDGNEALLKIAKQKAPLSQQARYAQAAAIEALAKRKELKFANDAEAKALLSMAQQNGANTNAILKARPDLAGHLTKPDGTPMTIKDAMDKITPGDFWQNIQAESLDNQQARLSPVQISKINETIKEALNDGSKLNAITRSMRPKEKKIIIESINNNSALFAQISDDALDTITSDPRWPA